MAVVKSSVLAEIEVNCLIAVVQNSKVFDLKKRYLQLDDDISSCSLFYNPAYEFLHLANLVLTAFYYMRSEREYKKKQTSASLVHTKTSVSALSSRAAHVTRVTYTNRK